MFRHIADIYLIFSSYCVSEQTQGTFSPLFPWLAQEETEGQDPPNLQQDTTLTSSRGLSSVTRSEVSEVDILAMIVPVIPSLFHDKNTNAASHLIPLPLDVKGNLDGNEVIS